MAGQADVMERLAGQVRAALEVADLDAYASLLDAGVRWRPPGGRAVGEADRWQVLTVRGGRITAITGFAERDQAAAWAGLRTNILCPRGLRSALRAEAP